MRRECVWSQRERERAQKQEGKRAIRKWEGEGGRRKEEKEKEEGGRRKSDCPRGTTVTKWSVYTLVVSQDAKQPRNRVSRWRSCSCRETNLGIYFKRNKNIKRRSWVSIKAATPWPCGPDEIGGEGLFKSNSALRKEACCSSSGMDTSSKWRMRRRFSYFLFSTMMLDSLLAVAKTEKSHVQSSRIFIPEKGLWGRWSKTIRPRILE